MSIEFGFPYWTAQPFDAHGPVVTQICDFYPTQSYVVGVFPSPSLSNSCTPRGVRRGCPVSLFQSLPSTSGVRPDNLVSPPLLKWPDLIGVPSCMRVTPSFALRFPITCVMVRSNSPVGALCQTSGDTPAMTVSPLFFSPLSCDSHHGAFGVQVEPSFATPRVPPRLPLLVRVGPPGCVLGWFGRLSFHPVDSLAGILFIFSSKPVQSYCLRRETFREHPQQPVSHSLT